MASQKRLPSDGTWSERVRCPGRDAVKNAVQTAGKSLRDLRVGEVSGST